EQGGGGEGRAANRPEGGASTDRRHGEAASEMPDPAAGRAKQCCRYARAVREVTHHQEQWDDRKIEGAESPVHFSLEKTQKRYDAGDGCVTDHSNHNHAHPDRNPQRNKDEEHPKSRCAQGQIAHGVALGWGFDPPLSASARSWASVYAIVRIKTIMQKISNGIVHHR